VIFKFLSEKLVRDKTVERYESENGSLSYRILTENADFERELYKKLLEEAKEVITAKDSDELISELADIYDVLSAIATHKQISTESIEKARKERLELRGGFSKKIYSLIGTIPETSAFASFIKASPEKYLQIKEFAPQKKLSTDSSSYKYLFGQLKTELFDALARQLITIQHIGSTSVKNAPAQPAIDLLATTTSLLDFDINAENLLHLGWIKLGEHGIENRRLFVKTAAHNNTPIAYLHIFEKDNPVAKKFYATTKKIFADQNLLAEFTQIREDALNAPELTADSYAAAKNRFFEKM